MGSVLDSGHEVQGSSRPEVRPECYNVKLSLRQGALQGFFFLLDLVWGLYPLLSRSTSNCVCTFGERVCMFPVVFEDHVVLGIL